MKKNSGCKFAMQRCVLETPLMEHLFAFDDSSLIRRLIRHHKFDSDSCKTKVKFSILRNQSLILNSTKPSRRSRQNSKQPKRSRARDGRLVEFVARKFARQVHKLLFFAKHLRIKFEQIDRDRQRTSFIGTVLSQEGIAAIAQMLSLRNRRLFITVRVETIILGLGVG
jgi:hypothetical protein